MVTVLCMCYTYTQLYQSALNSQNMTTIISRASNNIIIKGIFSIIISDHRHNFHNHHQPSPASSLSSSSATAISTFVIIIVIITNICIQTNQYTKITPKQIATNFLIIVSSNESFSLCCFLSEHIMYQVDTRKHF